MLLDVKNQDLAKRLLYVGVERAELVVTVRVLL